MAGRFVLALNCVAVELVRIAFIEHTNSVTGPISIYIIGDDIKPVRASLEVQNFFKAGALCRKVKGKR
jgi:hypothetical protein